MSQPQWVKLNLVPQTEGADMPEYVVGLLMQEVAGSYVLNPMLEVQCSKGTGKQEYVSAGMNFINKTYVWRCQILNEKPDLAEADDYESYDYDEGSLG